MMFDDNSNLELINILDNRITKLLKKLLNLENQIMPFNDEFIDFTKNMDKYSIEFKNETYKRIKPYFLFLIEVAMFISNSIIKTFFLKNSFRSNNHLYDDYKQKFHKYLMDITPKIFILMKLGSNNELLEKFETLIFIKKEKVFNDLRSIIISRNPSSYNKSKEIWLELISYSWDFLIYFYHYYCINNNKNSTKKLKKFYENERKFVNILEQCYNLLRIIINPHVEYNVKFI